MQRASVLVRDALHYRKSCFEHGVALAGYSIKSHINDPGPGDLLVVWNRSFVGAEDAQRFERLGATVVVAENGYLGKGFLGGNWYALALDHHAGAGRWHDGGPHRWDGLGVKLHPWHRPGGETIILEQRGIGERGIKSPEGWAEKTREQFGGRIRAHPGKRAPSIELEKDLAHASRVITWASSAALQALMLGVPVWYEMPQWIGASAARPLSEFGQEPRCDDDARLAMFRRLAWAMWQIGEIDDGTAFKHLLGAKT